LSHGSIRLGRRTAGTALSRNAGLVGTLRIAIGVRRIRSPPRSELLPRPARKIVEISADLQHPKT